MTLGEVKTLLDFHYWARDRMLEAVSALTPEQFTRDLSNSFSSVHHTVVHIYSADWVWYSRWKGHSPTAPLAFDAYPDVPAVRAAWIDLESGVRTLLDELGEAGIKTSMPYRLMNGTAGESLFWQMVQHVVNHASYHRGQVTTMLRQLGAAAPKSTDMITFYRERSARTN